jgi:hypothetical protein
MNKTNFMNFIPNKFMGLTRPNKKKESESYSRMKINQIAKRRAKNKVARKSRRINRLRAI